MWSTAAVVIALCAPGARVDGVGARVERVETMAARPDRLHVAGAVDVEVLAAAADEPVQVSVSVEQNLQPMVVTTASDGTLRISVVGEPVSLDGIVVKVRMPPPRSIVVTGAARVAATVSGAVRAEVSGAARARLIGAAERLELVGRGAATIDAAGVSATEATVDIAGATEVDVGPARGLKVTGSGVGLVRYRGDPRLHTAVSPTVKVTRSRS